MAIEDELAIEAAREILTPETAKVVELLGSGDFLTGLRRAMLLAQARVENDPVAVRFVELLIDEEGIEPELALAIALQACGYAPFVERNWMGTPATVIASLAEPAWRRGRQRTLAWLREYLRRAIGLNSAEISACEDEVAGILRERSALRGKQSQRKKRTRLRRKS